MIERHLLLIYLEKNLVLRGKIFIKGMIIPHRQVNPEEPFLHPKGLLHSENIGDNNVQIKGGYFYRM